MQGASISMRKLLRNDSPSQYKKKNVGLKGVFSKSRGHSCDMRYFTIGAARQNSISSTGICLGWRYLLQYNFIKNT